MGVFTYSVRLFFFTIIVSTVFGFAQGVGGSAEGVVQSVKVQQVQRVAVQALQSVLPQVVEVGAIARCKR